MRALLLLIVNIPSIVLAAGGGEIPLKMVTIQTINLLLACGVLVYFTRKVVVSHFVSRHEDFNSEVKKAEEAKSQAEEKKKEISERLIKLQSTQEETLRQVKADAEALREKIVNDAKILAKKLEEESYRSAQLELQKAKEVLRYHLLEKSVAMAQEKMRDQVDGSDLQRMRSEFVEKIQVVQ